MNALAKREFFVRGVHEGLNDGFLQCIMLTSLTGPCTKYPVVRACISAGHLFRVRVASTFGLLLEGLLIHQVCYGSVGFQSYGVVKHAQRVLGTVMGGYFPKS